MYVAKDHGFPFQKWHYTSQLVQQFACKSSLKWAAKIWQVQKIIVLLKSPFQNQRPDPKVCGERKWLPICFMV